ncbi:MAG: HIT domain-containing protein [Deltaproteobacteria bacterium]|nr:HIT domain-containing protein [Deltaproteobacteria bacterium]
MTYVAGDAPPPGSCIFCDRPKASDARENLVVHTAADTVVMLNRFPYNPGHLLVAPRSHVADLGALGASDFAALMERLRDAAAILKRELRPDAMNVGLNLGRVAGAGIDAHLHWHIVPRWDGDTNFMPVTAATKVIPQHLHETWDKLAPHFR